MSILVLEKRRKMEFLYRELERVRNQMKSLLTINVDELTIGNIRLLELEEEKLLSKLLKMKTLDYT
ncbi:MAG: hypothetical protein KDC88_01055 [Ignavibacteriae bacterium]|nr:hypothetical protein [Ignavibacteriota bacterium]MCB9210526.1 hypothetical protein [Ignavibacteriales bacterium]MCB9219859.1 hypothetical protein [Ignavibacteriales bacterium]MCB9257732.1 hypothetical protein [Ignavibacteriales bacterium]